MVSNKDKATSLLTAMCEAPAMYAQTRDAFVACVCGILWMVDDDFDGSAFSEQHLPGSTFHDIADAEWASKVIAHAVKVVEETE